MKKISDKKLFDGQWISLYETVFENRRRPGGREIDGPGLTKPNEITIMPAICLGINLKTFGEVAEWPNAAVSKTVTLRKWGRGFKSFLLR